MTIGFLAQEREHEKVSVAIYVGRASKPNHGSYARGCMLDCFDPRIRACGAAAWCETSCSAEPAALA